MKYRVHIDRFSVGLDELTRKQQASAVEVLKVLHAAGRFSVFEATDNDVIAKTMERLVHQKLIEVDTSPGFPWSNVKLTAAGRERIGLSGG